MPSKLMRAKEIAKTLSIGLSTWWLWVKTGKVPAGIKLSKRVTVWKAEDVQAFISESVTGEVSNG